MGSHVKRRLPQLQTQGHMLDVIGRGNPAHLRAPPTATHIVLCFKQGPGVTKDGHTLGVVF